MGSSLSSMAVFVIVNCKGSIKHICRKKGGGGICPFLRVVLIFSGITQCIRYVLFSFLIDIQKLSCTKLQGQTQDFSRGCSWLIAFTECDNLRMEASNQQNNLLRDLVRSDGKTMLDISKYSAALYLMTSRLLLLLLTGVTVVTISAKQRYLQTQ